ncbi:hypothetical protein ACFW6E_36685 [Streptomyces olivaceoviridis]|uniref:hypothetical protein n=1 Tax=Streptomyces olivaceoviridis TaxID=1921 RepID=UPI0036A15EE4
MTVLIPETEPERLWQRLLRGWRGAVAAPARGERRGDPPAAFPTAVTRGTVGHGGPLTGAGPVPYETRQSRERRRKGAVNGWPDPAREAVSSERPVHRTPLQELAMADLAFVVTVLASFALVALIAKGVTKL